MEGKFQAVWLYRESPLLSLVSVDPTLQCRVRYRPPSWVLSLSTVNLLLSPKTCFASKDYCHSKIFLSLIHNI